MGVKKLRLVRKSVDNLLRRFLTDELELVERRLYDKHKVCPFTYLVSLRDAIDAALCIADDDNDFLTEHEV